MRTKKIDNKGVNRLLKKYSRQEKVLLLVLAFILSVLFQWNVEIVKMD